MNDGAGGGMDEALVDDLEDDQADYQAGDRVADADADAARAPAAGADDRRLVARAVDGDQDALTEVARRVQDPLYRLALRMTGAPADAEDAVQEILIRILTRLATFQGEAALVTWAYRIALNHLINLRRRPARELLTFDGYRRDLLDGLAAPAPADPGPEGALLADEVRLLCTQALLQCLDRPGRAAYVLGDVLQLSGEESAWILGISSPAYRKRLERARRQVREALNDRCGLLDRKAPCHCGKRIGYARAKGRIGEDGPVLAVHKTVDARQTAVDLGRLRDVGELIRSHPNYAAPEARVDAVLALARSGRFEGVLREDDVRES